MLVIRPAQLAAIQRANLQDRLIADFRAEAPERWAVLGPAATVRVVREAFDRAAACGFTTAPAIALFVRIALVFGAGFEERQAWAAAALAEGRDGDEAARSERLRAAALWHLRELEVGKVV